MIAPVLPENEEERLASLHALELLDSPKEQRFDRIVSLTKAVMGVPIAYIALIDSDRQWFKSKVGMCDVVTQTSRDESFCGHAILQDTPLVIEDALKDPRFFDNPMVTGEPFVRFYAGHPLQSQAGHNIATLCVVDKQPRTFSGDDMDRFAHLAAMAERELSMLGVIATQHEMIETRNALVASQQALARELSEAADYVYQFLPAREVGIDEPVHIDYQFIASSRLGGDLLGYHSIDDDHQAFWLLDVTGHGVGASLLSVSAGNAIRSGQLNADPRDPAALVETLNNAFPMDRNNDKFFTIWYGVYQRSTRTLTYAAAGHHPATLIDAQGNRQSLGVPGLMIGVIPDNKYQAQSIRVEAGSRLYLFSDGLYEVRGGENDKLLGLDGIGDLIKQANCGNSSKTRLEQVVSSVHAYRGGEASFDDDVSLLEVAFVK
ncbi:MAG: SpoIIE family protein phosphatase [Phycisphaeraceae bacterium]|nr:SpoIIE family protein phosphatase [Phycisphaeraceae bacterium]